MSSAASTKRATSKLYVKDMTSLPVPGMAAASVGHVDMDAEHAHVALDVWGAEIVHNLAIVDGRPFKIGRAQLVDGGSARCVLRQVQTSVQARLY
jgi:hypothetical protein